MGKRNRYNKQSNKSNEPLQTDGTKANQSETHKPYQDIVRENESFIRYYKEQNVCPPDDWNDFIDSMKSDLPATFRITASRDEAQTLLQLIEGQFISEILLNGSTDNELVKTPKIFPLPWYPDKMAWQLDITRKDIRRSESFYKLHNFLITETDNGTISRQETVSMIPPLVLDVQPHHKVLDMCAAPGSKTAQLIEFLHKGTGTPTGFVVANDVDNKRCYMLVHQAKRLNSPCIAITNSDAAIFPNLIDANEQKIEFDRILCDVPCSGDGTMRKNPDIWMKWSPANGLNQHGVQSRVIRRAAELLKVGGRLVYSTCSLNPLENEAVIHRLLTETDGALKLVDVKDALPGLKSIPGMDHWKVGSRNLEFYDKFEDVDEKWQTTIRPQMFPPKSEDTDKYELHKCIRILPHLQDTGAFFVAVLEKINDINNESVQKYLPASRKRKRDDKRTGYKEDPFVFFNEDEQIWPSIKEFYAISDTFDPKCLLTRCNVGKKKNIYFACSQVKDLVLLNQERVKFINTGVKTFVRSDNRHMKCAFRLANEGLESIMDVVGSERKATVHRNDLIAMLQSEAPLQISALSAELQKRVEELSAGSCVLIFVDEPHTSLALNLVGWRGVTTFRCYITQNNTVHLLRLLGENVDRFDVNKFQKNVEETNG